MRTTIILLFALVAMASAKPVIDTTSPESSSSEERVPGAVERTTAAAEDSQPRWRKTRTAGEAEGAEMDLAELRSAEESEEDDEAMDGAETVAFRPLFVHRDRIARYGSKVRARRQATRRQPPRTRTPPLRSFRKGRKPLQILY